MGFAVNLETDGTSCLLMVLQLSTVDTSSVRNPTASGLVLIGGPTWMLVIKSGLKLTMIVVANTTVGRDMCHSDGPIASHTMQSGTQKLLQTASYHQEVTTRLPIVERTWQPMEEICNPRIK
jgi:hypothetical protein